MTAKTESNGQARRTLASQLDRLDGILDGLSDGLNQAVADAVRDAVGVAVKEAAAVAVREALQAVLTEVLTNPTLLEHLQPPAPPTPPVAVPAQRPSLRERMSPAGTWAGRKAQAACTSCRRALASLGSGLLALWRLRTRLLAAVSIGATIGLGAYLAGPWLSALAGGVAGGVVNLVHRVRGWFQQTFLRHVLADATP